MPKHEPSSLEAQDRRAGHRERCDPSLSLTTRNGRMGALIATERPRMAQAGHSAQGGQRLATAYDQHRPQNLLHVGDVRGPAGSIAVREPRDGHSSPRAPVGRASGRRTRDDGRRSGAGSPSDALSMDFCPGTITVHGFGQVECKFQGGRLEQVPFFASRLRHSCWLLATRMPMYSPEYMVAALRGHFLMLGGVPLLALFPRKLVLATGFLREDPTPAWHGAIRRLADSHAFALWAPSLRGRPRDCDADPMDIVEAWSVAHCPFEDLAALDEGLTTHLEDVNTRAGRQGQPSAAELVHAERANLRPF
jgi:hypothetical protein